MKIKHIIDISRKIRPGMVIWPGDRGVEIKREASIKEGAVCNLSSIVMGLHTGTHVDAPFHFIDDGIDIGKLDLSRFIGFVKVLEVKAAKSISYENIKGFTIEKGDILFFKTPNSSCEEDGSFKEHFVYIDESAANYLVDKGVKAIGVDYLSVDGFNAENHPAHNILLGNEIGVMEGLDLRNVNPGEYFFSCLPLNIQDVDGSPARAVLVEFEP